MIDIDVWIKKFAERVESVFGDRAWFVGLQGSYGRGEATATSDIDAVLILDELRLGDLNIYRELLDTLPHRELVCGFVAGKNELLGWEASDLFQFYYDTTPVKGTLEPLLKKIDRQAVRRAIRIGACNVYHACVHNFVHEKSEEILRSLYKSAVFAIRAVWFYETGKFIKTNAGLQADIVPPSAVLATALSLKEGASVRFEEMTELLLNWASAVIGGYGE